jgi:hypothetical protein
MKSPSTISKLWLVVVSLCFSAPQAVIASLSGPPPSFAIPTADGEHIFVMLSSVPIAEDQGNDRTLSDGVEVKLRDRYASSGLYPLDSCVPIWTVNWYGEEGMVHLSEDGRYIVRVNRFGGGGYGEGISLKWGVKFYDSGREIAIHHVRDLVDYPSLMPFTSRDWHCLWIDNSENDSEVKGRTFELRTTTHEWYRFDVGTGEIIEQRRLWKKVRLGVGLLCIACVGAGFLVMTRRRRYQLQEECDASPEPERNKPLKFSCRFLFAGMTVVSVVCGLVRFAPHWAVFLIGLSLTVFSTCSFLRRKRTHNSTSRTLRSFCRAGTWAWILTTWFLLYGLSAGPVLGITYRLDWPHDCRMFVASTMYAPLFWLEQHSPMFESKTIRWYFDAWK